MYQDSRMRQGLCQVADLVEDWGGEVRPRISVLSVLELELVVLKLESVALKLDLPVR